MVDVRLDPLRWNLGEAGDEALLESWLVEEGDHVNAGQTLCNASLVEQTIEIKAPAEGVVEQIAVAAGERFAPDYILARLVRF